MTGARLSPAASLLRRSKLFALPASVPLPPPKASSEPVFEVETATTIYPTRAAIQTPSWSLSKGDWGLKRALPLSSTTKSTTPVIRLRGGIDSAEHVTDFESASDHVVTLRKWDELNVKLLVRPKIGGPNDRLQEMDRRGHSVFESELDNATNLTISCEHVDTHKIAEAQIPSHLKQARDKFAKDQRADAEAKGYDLPVPQTEPSKVPQQPKRWRYGGPWLAGMTDLQFDAYLNSISDQRKAQFVDHLKRSLKAKRETELNTVALHQGLSAEPKTTVEITPEDVTTYLRYLRSSPKDFGPEIAVFLDLPEGPDQPSVRYSGNEEYAEGWQYGRDTVAVDVYRNVGPPSTHPSAGFSYVRSSQHSRNDPVLGPQNRAKPIPARILREPTYIASRERQQGRQNIGVAGIVARVDMQTTNDVRWQPQRGGTKVAVVLTEASVQSSGAIQIGVGHERGWALDSEEVPFNSKVEVPQTPQQLFQAQSNIPRLDEPRLRRSIQTSSGGSRAATKVDEDTSGIFSALRNSFQQSQEKDR